MPASGEEYAALVADIQAHRLREPILVTRRAWCSTVEHRLRALREVDLPIPVEVVSPATPAEARALVISMNLHRGSDRRPEGRPLRPGSELKDPAAATALVGTPQAAMKAEAQQSQRAGLKEESPVGLAGIQRGERTSGSPRNCSPPGARWRARRAQARAVRAPRQGCVRGAVRQAGLSGTRPANTPPPTRDATPRSTGDLLKTVALPQRATLQGVESMILGVFRSGAEGRALRPVVAQFLTLLAERCASARARSGSDARAASAGRPAPRVRPRGHAAAGAASVSRLPRPGRALHRRRPLRSDRVATLDQIELDLEAYGRTQADAAGGGA